MLAGEVDRGDDVGDVGAAGDEGRVAVDHRVVDRAGGVVGRVAGLDERAAHACRSAWTAASSKVLAVFDCHGSGPP